MIASVRGTLTERDTNSCVVEAAGVGYLLHVSTYTARSLPKVGEAVMLYTRQVVREDALELFGFVEKDEVKLFDLLIGVTRVGPRLALAVLSGLKPAALARAIREEQVGALAAVPGIGRKTAERLVVELRDKLEAPIAERRETGVLPRGERYEDAVAALTGLGYTAAQANDAIRRVTADQGDLSLEDMVRRSLALLAKPAVTAR